MLRKDYEAIAGALHKANFSSADSADELFDTAVNEIAAVLAADNDRFDIDRFMKAVYE